MLLHAKNGTAAGADYIRFGTGRKNLILLPGLGDGLRTVKGTALPMALYYRSLAKDYTVYIFSRKRELSRGCTTRDMARDLKEAMDALGLEKASLVGVSMGGMIAQHFAADYPQRLEKLVLAVTSGRENPVLLESLNEWQACAKAGDHMALMDSNIRRIYSDAYYRKNKWMIPLTGNLMKPKSYDRFLIMAEACRSHNAWETLSAIRIPTCPRSDHFWKSRRLKKRCFFANILENQSDGVTRDGKNSHAFPRGTEDFLQTDRAGLW